FTISRTGDTSLAASVNYTVSGAAVDSADFGGSLPTNVNVPFSAGTGSVIITINVSGDSTVEPSEAFTVTLSNPTLGTVTGSPAPGTIQNDDAAFSIAALPAVKTEGNSATPARTFTISRTGDTSVAASVNYSVSGVAVDAADFGGT